MLQDASSHEGPAQSGAESSLPPIADHVLLRRIGRGSYGEVWLAQHTMGMYRAVKVVHRSLFGDQRPFERELAGIRTFEPISRSHEGFIDILHVGLNERDAYFYYVMELGDDRTTGSEINPAQYWPKTLARELNGRSLDYRSCLQLGLDLTRALAELHRNGLVHRDIKPSNILFVNDVPKLADIGLVSQVDEARSYVGTEGFIPPEGPGTAAADVYALGKVLYESITGKDRLDYPDLPADWDTRPDHEHFRELNEVILSACDVLERRYKTAQEMHADLVVLLHGKSVRRLKSLERQLARIKRVAGLLGLAAVAAAAVLYTIYRARTLALELKEDQIASLVEHGNYAMNSGDFAGALPYLTQAMQLDSGNVRRKAQHEIRLGSVISQCPKIVQMWFDPKEVYEVGLSPDGQRLLMIEGLGQARIFDIATGRALTPRFGQNTGLLRGTFSFDGNLVVTASEDNTACVWRSSDASMVASLEHPSRPLSAALSPDGRQIVTACTDKLAWVWDIAAGQPRWKLAGHTNAVLYATFSHDGKLIATGSRDFTARIWDASTGRQIGKPLPHSNWVDFLAFSPDDALLVTACEDRKARIWDVKTHQKILPDLSHDEIVSSAGFSPDGRLIVTGSFDGTARIWLAKDHQPFAEAPVLRHSERVKHVAFAADGHRIATACLDGTVRIWDLAGAEVASELKSDGFSQDMSRFLTLSNGTVIVRDTISRQPVSNSIKPPGRVEDAILSGDGRFVLSASRPTNDSGPLARMWDVWDTGTGKKIGSVSAGTNDLQNARLSGDGKRFLVFDADSARVFDSFAGVLSATLSLQSEEIRSALFDPAGDAVALWGEQALGVFDAGTGRALFPPIRHPFSIKDVEFSNDGKEVVSCGADSSLAPCYARVWDAFTGTPLTRQLMHGDGVLCSAFSPDGCRLFTGGEDSKLIIWELPGGNQQAFVKHRDKVLCVAVSRDGKQFATGSLDKTARVWIADSGNALTPPLRHHSMVKAVRFLNDGFHLITSDGQSRSWVWQLPQEQRPVQDLLKLSRLLSGETILPLSSTGSRDGDSLEKTWNEVQKRNPSEVTVSREELANWYDFQAEESELEGNPSATAFYLDQLLKLKGQDSALLERLARAKHAEASMSAEH